MVNDPLFGRLVVIFLFGPPFGVLHLVTEEKEGIGVFLFILYILLAFPAIKWLDQKKIVRKGLSGFVVVCLSIMCFWVIYENYA